MVRCPICKQICAVECGKCWSVLDHLGQEHNCPEPDEGFYDSHEGCTIVCEWCDIELIPLDPAERV